MAVFRGILISYNWRVACAKKIKSGSDGKKVVLPLPKAQFMALYSKIRTLIKNDWTLRPGMRALRGCT